MPDLKLTKAGTGDTGEINRLATLIWNQHYPSVISQSQIDFMLEKMYSREALNEQMFEKQHQFYFVFSGGKNQGFISVHEEAEHTWFINKFYIDQREAGKGLGAAAMQALIGMIRPSVIRLTCNRQNYKSINFYFKMGFKIERVADFDIGNGYTMNDFVMVWKEQA